MTAEILPDLLRARAAEDPSAVALRLEDREELTYDEWDARSNAVAHGLAGRGVRPGDRVALAIGTDRWTDYAVAYLGVLKAGAVAVPVGRRFAGPELDRILDHAGAVVVVTSTGELADGQATTAFQAAVGPDDLAEILYTSGTTGTPKGVACTHLGLMAHDVPPDAAAAGGPRSFLHAFPVGTQAGQEVLRVPLRMAGRVAIALPTFDAEEACSLIARHGVVRLQLVPAMAQVLVASDALAGHDLPSVRRVILSSAPAPPALFEKLAEALPGATVWNAYALTEAGPARTLMQWDSDQPTAVGYPVGETEVRIVDEAGKSLGPDQPGEIWLRRRGTPPRSYYRDPEATAAVFVDGWTRTGDVGFLDPGGCLHLIDRSKDLIISGGSNVSPVEVENVLYEDPNVVEAAVFGVPHPVMGEDVAAAVVTKEPTIERHLQQRVRERLAEHSVPHRVIFVDRLPRNASGKVLKAELRNLAAAPASGSPSAAPGSTEATIASVWRSVLALPHVGLDEDFFALGGHSLAATQVASRLQDAFGVRLPVTVVFEAPTVAELAEAVRRAAI